MSKSVRANGASLRCEGRIRSSHQVTTSGNDRSRSVSPVGAQSTITQSNSPSSWWRLIWSSENSSSMPGRHGQLLGRDAVDAALGQQVAEPAPARRPSGAPSPPGPGPPGRTGSRPTWVGSAPSGGLERVGQAVRRVGGEDDGAQARRRRSGARSRRRRSSCRRRPCPCRGLCAAPSAPPILRARGRAPPRSRSLPRSFLPEPRAQLLRRHASR